jgi:predicted dehydrogenase
MIQSRSDRGQPAIDPVATNALGVAMIGLGLAVKPHALSLHDLTHKIDFVGGFSPSEARRNSFRQSYGLPVIDTLEALLADPRISAVMILTPPRTHGTLVERVARAGKHILLEKPLDVNLAGARNIVEMADECGVKLGVVFQQRFRVGVRTLHQILADGDLGDVIHASASIRWWRGADYYAQPGRGMLARDGGGVLLTQAIHTLDALLHLVGPALEVSARCLTSGLRAIDTEDVACATVRYANGAVGVIDATTTAYPGYPERIEIVGTRGSAMLEAESLVVHRPGKYELRMEGSREGGGGADPMAFSHAAHRALIEDFADSIRSNRDPLSSGLSALTVHALIDAILTSSATGQAVTVNR